MLPDVPDIPQTTAGGADPQEDCFEENATSLLIHFAGRPGVVQATVREVEIWEAAHGDDPAQGTDIGIGAACLTAHGLSSHVANQDLEAAPNRGNYSFPLVQSNYQGIPMAGGPARHFVTYLGEGWYRNPANGTRTNNPSLGPAYTGWCIEIDIPASAPAPSGADTLEELT